MKIRIMHDAGNNKIPYYIEVSTRHHSNHWQGPVWEKAGSHYTLEAARLMVDEMVAKEKQRIQAVRVAQPTCVHEVEVCVRV